MKNLFLNDCFKCLFVLLFFSAGAKTFAQTFDYVWSAPAGSGADEYANGVAVDSDGNVFTTGRFQGTADFDPGAGTVTANSNGQEDIFVSKYDPNGNLVWVIDLGSLNADLGFAICVNSNNEILVAGSFRGTVDFDPGAGVSNLVSAGNADGFVLKLSNDGNFIWVKGIHGATTQAILSVATDADDNVLVAGHTDANCDLDPGAGSVSFTPAGLNDVFVIKLDDSGNYVWSKTFGSTGNEIPYSIKTGFFGDVYVHGSFQLTADFDPGPGVANLTSTGAEDAFIWKLNTNGDFVYAKSIGGTGTDVGRGLTIDYNDHVYVCGYFSGTADLDPSPSVTANYTSAGQGDCYIVKMDNNGNMIWISTFGGTGNDYAMSCFYNDNTDELFTTGRFYVTVDFDPGVSNFDLTSAGDADIYVHRLAVDGSFVGAYQIGGVGNDLGFAIDGGSKTYVVGQFSSTSDFDPSASISNQTSVGLTDIFTACYSTCPLPAPLTSVTGSVSVCSGTTETYSVGTSSGAVNYTWTGPAGWTGTSLINTIDFGVNDISGFVSVTANNACGSTAPATIFVDAYLTPTVFVNGTSICENDFAQLEAATDAGTVYWYDALTGGTLLGTGLIYTTPILTSDATYYVEADNNGCKNDPRLAATVTVNPNPIISVSYSSGSLIASPAGATLYQWLDCNNSMVPISGETSANFILTNDGNYAVEVNLNGCVDTSSCIEIFLSNDKIENFDFSLYPNPSNGNVILNLPDGENTIRVYAITGELVYENSVNENTAEILLNVQPGNYLIEILGEGYLYYKQRITIN